MTVEDGSPRIKTGMLASGVVGTLFYAWLQGWIETFLLITNGIIGATDGYSAFQTELTEGLIGAALASLRGVWTGHAEWVASLGLAAYPVVVVETAVLTVLLVRVIALSVNAVQEGVL